jgi:hypothetical protein
MTKRCEMKNCTKRLDPVSQLIGICAKCSKVYCRKHAELSQHNCPFNKKDTIVVVGFKKDKVLKI